MQRQLSFLGATGTVSGSRYLLELGEQRFLIDCGLFQGFKQLRLRNWAPLPFAPASVTAVILTHAHIDHSGFLPGLVKQGFKGPIYCSPGTLELCRILLPDSGHLQEEEARFANRHGFSKHRPAHPLYSVADAEGCLRLFKAVPMGQPFEPAPGIKIILCRAGHILGACYVRIEHEGLRVTFSGDIGRPDDAVMKPPEPLSRTDYLITESTYGDRQHPPIDPMEELARWLVPACIRGGVTVIPAFAVGRAQAILLQVARLKDQKRIGDVPVFLDSPAATDVTGLYQRFSAEHRLSATESMRMCQGADFINSVEASKAVDRRRGPMIIVSASGMATGGRVVHHLKAFLGDARNLVLFAGFQASGTRGAALLSKASDVRIHGAPVSVRAEVGQLNAFSAHADATELLAWLRTLPTPPRMTFVTHGEPQASDVLRYRIEHELKWAVSVPDYRETVDLDAIGPEETNAPVSVGLPALTPLVSRPRA